MVPILIVVGIIATALLGGSNPFFSNNNSATQPGNSAFPPGAFESASCQPAIDSTKVIKVDIDPSVEDLYANDSKPEFNKVDDEWVLIKAGAPIPAWKVTIENEASGGKSYTELEKMGTAINIGGPANSDEGRDTYIGVGWCDPDTGESFGWGEVHLGRNGCLDPLVQDVIYVVDHQGSHVDDEPWLIDKEWANSENPDPPKTQENIDKYWWRFNVYYKASKLPANPTVEDLPCWIRVLADNCPGAGDVNGDNRVNAQDLPGCEGNVLQAADPEDEPFIFQKSSITLTSPIPGGVTLADNYIFVRETFETPADPIIGTAFIHYDVRIRIGDIEGRGVDHGLILEPQGDLSGPSLIYAPITDTSRPTGAPSLQLGSFVPAIPTFFYEWWTPACKPALYLYPEEEMAIKVKVEPEGHITESIPSHGEHGWDVIARPDGTIIDNVVAGLVPALEQATTRVAATTYPYLYYEASLKSVDIPKTAGWIRTRSELSAFFALTLEQLGLNEQERKDFLEYWIPKLQEGDTWFITLVNRAELDRVEPIAFSKEPDNFIRVRFYFEKLDEKNTNNFSPITQYEIPDTKPERTGFTVVDWGGIIGNGSCGVGEVSE